MFALSLGEISVMLDGKRCNDREATVAPVGAGRGLLSHINLLRSLTNEELSNIEQMCRYRRFTAGELIVDRDSTSNEVFFVIRGQVRIVNFSMSGREVTFDERSGGDYFGELSALDGAPRSASVVAEEETLILGLPRRAFLDLLTEHRSIACEVMLRLARSLRAANERIMDLSTLAANHRILADLLRQVHRHRLDGNGAIIAPLPVHSDIASRVSTTRETVARVLSDLARRGIVERRKHGLLIHDDARLRTMVEEVRR
jgi:CRP-like cAMP-binding protein